MRYFHLFWHASTSNWKFCLGFTRQTMAYWCYWYWLQEDFDSKPGALTICMVSWVCMNGLDMECGRGKLATRPNNKYQTRFHFSRLKKTPTTILSKFGMKKLRRICRTVRIFLIQSISAATHCCAQPLYFCVLLFTWIELLPDVCLSTQSMLSQITKCFHEIWFVVQKMNMKNLK